jgi:hypothetical protein
MQLTPTIAIHLSAAMGCLVTGAFMLLPNRDPGPLLWSSPGFFPPHP